MIYLLLLIALALLVAWLVSRKQSVKTEHNNERPDDCCGAHDVCESDSLLSASNTIEYYNDEELDSYKGTLPNGYTDQAIEEFRDVLYTLKENEVAGWMKSIQLRCIELPTIIREEALMIVEERRAKA
jgi:hypothetical protein